MTQREILAEVIESIDEEATGDARAMVEREEDAAIRWLGMDMFHEGDDVRLALHPKGHGVLMIVRVMNGAPYSTANIKLSRVQVQKLAQFMKEL